MLIHYRPSLTYRSPTPNYQVFISAFFREINKLGRNYAAWLVQQRAAGKSNTMYLVVYNTSDECCKVVLLFNTGTINTLLLWCTDVIAVNRSVCPCFCPSTSSTASVGAHASYHHVISYKTNRDSFVNHPKKCREQIVLITVYPGIPIRVTGQKATYDAFMAPRYTGTYAR